MFGNNALKGLLICNMLVLIYFEKNLPNECLILGWNLGFQTTLAKGNESMGMLNMGKVFKKNRPVQDFLISILNEKLEL